jgi:pyruvate dehydrogenase E2 component (dihydrolipoamide acetyltransferase)
MYEFKLPDLGEGIHEGEVLKWYVAVGDSIAEDAPLVEIETDKAAVTLPSPRAGKIVSLSGGIGDTVIVGDIITVIDDGSKTAAGKTPAAAVAPKAAAPVAAPAAVAKDKGRSAPAAPATRQLARELGVDIKQATPTGPGGRVTQEDVQRLAAGPAASAPPAAATAPATAKAAPSGIPFLEIEPLPDFEQWGPVEREPFRGIRRRVARKMVTSMVMVPHVGHTDEADITQLEEVRKRENKRREGRGEPRLTMLPFVIKAITAGLRKYPSFNASLDPFGEELIFKKYYNIGIAVDTPQGLMVPVIREADRKSVNELTAEIDDLATRAREGSLLVTELQAGTFTITNVGPLGGVGLVPVINYPEVAILGMGRAKQQPVVRDGRIVIRTILPMTIGFDHRVADGADAARLLSALVRQLSDPHQLLLET